MGLSKQNGRKLQILSGEYPESHQLDLLSFVTEQIPELYANEKKARVSTPRTSTLTSKVSSYHCHGRVDPNNSFSNYCLSKSNQFVIESVKRFISTKKNDFGLIFLKAASGLGKSHILHAVGNEMQLHKNSFYYSSPQLMSPLVDTFNMLKFYDIILIDDIEEIEGNAELQKIFCQLMDYASAGKIKIIITGSKLPKDLNGCDDRMKGKLSAGVTHTIEEMKNDLAYAIVELRCASLNLDLPDAVKRLVSNQVGFNVYGLEGLLYKFKNAVNLKNQKITLEIALEEIKDKKVIYRSDEFINLLNCVAKVFQVSREELSSSIRKKEFALARHVAMYILKEHKGLGIMKIAELFEKDHSSVVYAITRITKQVDNDESMKQKILSCLI